jgi:hypothetical protein
MVRLHPYCICLTLSKCRQGLLLCRAIYFVSQSSKTHYSWHRCIAGSASIATCSWSLVPVYNSSTELLLSLSQFNLVSYSHHTSCILVVHLTMCLLIHAWPWCPCTHWCTIHFLQAVGSVSCFLICKMWMISTAGYDCQGSRQLNPMHTSCYSVTVSLTALIHCAVSLHM